LSIEPVAAGPRLLVLSSLFPSASQPAAGVFIRERMFRVAQHLPVVVVAPQPWFPLQGLVRLFRPHFRPKAPAFELMQGIEVHRPRFLSFPGILKWSDGLFMALGSYLTVRRLFRQHALHILDVHFGYPDGAAGTLLGHWLKVPVVLTLRGKEERQARTVVGPALRRAVLRADRLIAVSEALRDLALGLGADARRITVIGNGIDLSKFQRVPQAEARAQLDLPQNARMLISVGTLVERKGFHRVIECLPHLLVRYQNLHYLVVGGSGPEGDFSAKLRAQVVALGLQQRVHFLGLCAPEQLKFPLSAADVFVLASSYEGWANVLLEALACGLPVVATDVGGNAQVINSGQLGRIVPFGDSAALGSALDEALSHAWNRAALREYARSNSWEDRIPLLVNVFRQLFAEGPVDTQVSVAAEHENAR
jgi:teichuronic acid biosynthesis glycosyltransferase TuaC